MKNVVSVIAFLLLVSANPLSAAPMDTDQAVRHLAYRLFARAHGDIAQVKQDIVYIALGEQEGILEGSEFDIVRLGAPIQVGNELLGYEEKLIGKAVAERVQERLTVARMLAKLEAARVGDRAYLRRQPVTRLVIAPFTIEDKVSGLGLGIQENLITALLSKGITVVERSQLEQVLEEQQLGLSGLVNLASAKKLGELLGADTMIVGSLRDLGEAVEINARLVSMESGTGFSAAQARISKTAVVAQQLAQVSKPMTGGITKTTGISGSRSTSKPDKPFSMFENDFVRIEVVSLANVEKGALMKLKFTNIGKDVVWLSLSDLESCYVAKQDGSRRVCKEVSWVDNQRSQRQIELVPDVPRAESIQLDSVDQINGSYIFTTRLWSRGGNVNELLIVIRDIYVE
ncbi:FlgO family outer membrane protein [Thiocapsa imhoffii]|nr:FlgO family outer membrane protein [Thiocapsa imhoffii]